MVNHILEKMAFGGSDLNRAEEVRRNETALEKAKEATSSRTIVFCDGQILADEHKNEIIRLPLDHVIVAKNAGSLTFVGFDRQTALFAVTLPDEKVTAAQRLQSSLPGASFMDIRSQLSTLDTIDGEAVAAAASLFSWHRSHRFCANCGHSTESIFAGWQRRCPACDTMHFPRTDPVVIMLITRGNMALIGRSHGWPTGMFSLLAGFMEPGETIEAAVRREVKEETGISVGPVSLITNQPWPFPSSLMIGCHGTAYDAEIKIDTNELEDAFWITRETMSEVFGGLSSEITAARKGTIARFLINKWLSGTLG